MRLYDNSAKVRRNMELWGCWGESKPPSQGSAAAELHVRSKAKPRLKQPNNDITNIIF